MIRFLTALLLSGLCLPLPAVADPALLLTSNVTWTNHRSYFGGLSGAEISSDGSKITVISDQGYLLYANILRQQGTIHAMQIEKIIGLTDQNGIALAPEFTDSEGLAVDQRGRGYISFEERHRIASVDFTTGRTRVLPGHPDFARLRENAGFEALAIHPNGTLYTLPETGVVTRGGFPLYVFQNNKWTRHATIPRRGPFLPVGADFSSDGALYLLERAATPLGFRSRIRRFDLTTTPYGEETLLRTRPGRFDNLETLSVWQDSTGDTRLTLVSDDNFLSIQKTQIIEYKVIEPAK